MRNSYSHTLSLPDGLPIYDDGRGDGGGDGFLSEGAGLRLLETGGGAKQELGDAGQPVGEAERSLCSRTEGPSQATVVPDRGAGKAVDDLVHPLGQPRVSGADRKSTRLNSSH